MTPCRDASRNLLGFQIPDGLLQSLLRDRPLRPFRLSQKQLPAIKGFGHHIPFRFIPAPIPRRRLPGTIWCEGAMPLVTASDSLTAEFLPCPSVQGSTPVCKCLSLND